MKTTTQTSKYSMVRKFAWMAVVCLASTVSGHAQILFQDTFESDTIGGAVTGWTINPTNVVFTAQSGSSPGGLGANLVVANVNSAGQSGFYSLTDGFATQTNTQIKTEFSLQITSNADFRYGVGTSAGATSTYTRFVNTGTPGSTQVQFFNGSVFLNSAVVLSLNKWYDVSEVFNIAAQTYNFSMTNITDNTAPVTVSNIPFYNTQHSVSGFSFTSVNNGFGNYNINDMTVTSVPEPSSQQLVIAAAIGFAGIYYGRRRRGLATTRLRGSV